MRRSASDQEEQIGKDSIPIPRSREKGRMMRTDDLFYTYRGKGGKQGKRELVS